jgi:pyruvate kinase
MSLPAAYDIVATLGPATASPDHWRALHDAGATRFRLNTSHLTVDELRGWLRDLEALETDARRTELALPPLVLDLQGSKWRIGEIERGELEAGEEVDLVLSGEPGDAGGARSRTVRTIPVPHPDFFVAAGESDGRILINDARVALMLEALDAAAASARARVERGGPVDRAKGITLPATSYRSESLSQKDRRIAGLAPGPEARGAGGNHGGAEIQLAISYVRDGAEVAAYLREVGEGVRLVAKVERPTAVADLESIAGACDEIWICRGDLGAEMGLARMARAVAEAAAHLPVLDVPVLVAGQVLEHMSASAQPTRAEIVQLHDLLADGFAGVVLSDETAVGRYPVEAVRAAALFREGA